jgi:PrcB C-terminal
MIPAVIPVISCSSPEINKTQLKGSELINNWTILLSDRQCGIQKAKNVIIKSKKEFDNLWEEIKTDRPDQPAKPVVDFKSKWVIACFLGEVNSAGNSIELTSVKNEAGTTVIRYTHKKPGSNCMTAQVIESPYLLAAIDHFEPAAVEFKVTIITSKCE